jgi:hypothetical protein
MAFTIKNQEEFNECLLWVSDLYKDAYGFRPRGYNFSVWTFKELESFVNDLSDSIAADVAYEKEIENKAIEDVMSMGVDRKTALRWLDQADAYFMYGDDVFYEDSIEKYGWVSRYMESNRNLKSVA